LKNGAAWLSFSEGGKKVVSLLAQVEVSSIQTFTSLASLTAIAVSIVGIYHLRKHLKAKQQSALEASLFA